MYRIKPKPGNNVVINDLKLRLRSCIDNWTEITDEKFEKSKDILKVKHLLIIEKYDGKEESNIIVSEQKVNNDIIKLDDNVFVHKGELSFSEKPQGVFVAEKSDVDNNLQNNDENIIKNETTDNIINEGLNEINIDNVKEDIFVHEGDKSFNEVEVPDDKQNKKEENFVSKAPEQVPEQTSKEAEVATPVSNNEKVVKNTKKVTPNDKKEVKNAKNNNKKTSKN